MKKRIDKFISEENGQSIFEFISFVPFYLVLMSVFINLSGAINGSINQQKAVRGYFYYNLRGNSRGLDRVYISKISQEGVSQMGYYALGYMEEQVGEVPKTTCYEMRNFIPGAEQIDTCEQKPDYSENVTQYVRVSTADGVCTETLVENGNGDLAIGFGNNGCRLVK